MASHRLVELPAHEAHVWFVREDEVQDPALIEAYRGLLNDEERQRHQRFLLERHRHEFLLTRALIRSVLSRYAAVAPGDWAFSVGPYGRPVLAGPEGAPPLLFNLSNTAGLVACVVALQGDVGIDVENIERHSATVELADRYFSPQESAALKALPPERQRRRFFEYWTLKEAFIKALGLGLHLPLDQFSFVLSPEAPVRVELDPRLNDDPTRWRFAQYQPTSRHFMALALGRAGSVEMKVVVREIVPLGEDSD
jgi:4'-phosphopantetheinyl transferase